MNLLLSVDRVTDVRGTTVMRQAESRGGLPQISVDCQCNGGQPPSRVGVVRNTSGRRGLAGLRARNGSRRPKAAGQATVPFHC
jgi:hypothetical protein